MSGITRYDGPSLVHLGYVKTATTFLQRHVFRDSHQGFAQAGGPLSRGHIVAGLIVCDAYTFDAAAQARRFAELEEDARNQGLIPVWSEEVLLGDPIAGRYDGAANIARLTASLPNARILVTIREQRAMALSIWREIIKAGHTAPLRDVIGTGQEAPAFRPHLWPDFLHFDRAVHMLHDSFGAQNVLVLPQETLRTDPAGWFDRLGQFLDRPLTPPQVTRTDNRGRGAVALAVNRQLNHVVRRSPLQRETGLAWRLKDRLVTTVDRVLPHPLNTGAEARLRARIESRYEGMFATSNTRLMALTDLPLDQLGYQSHG